MDDQLERIKIKQALFREQKRLFEEKLTNQEEFERYLNSLIIDENCVFMSGIREIVSLCNDSSFNCKFRSDEYYSLGQSPKKECNRLKMLRYEKILSKSH